VLAWHIREGHYDDVPLAGFNLLAVGAFQGNLWTGEAKPAMGFFIDERANERQRGALQMIFGGQAGGWPAGFAAPIGVRAPSVRKFTLRSTGQPKAKIRRSLASRAPR
jgi:hypothetical protein